jgi:hypothetical protein
MANKFKNAYDLSPTGGISNNNTDKHTVKEIKELFQEFEEIGDEYISDFFSTFILPKLKEMNV